MFSLMSKSRVDRALEARAIAAKYQGLADVCGDFGRAAYSAMADWWRRYAEELEQPPETKLNRPSRTPE